MNTEPVNNIIMIKLVMISVEMIAEKIDKNLEDTEAIVNGLLKEGAIYQDKPGHYKII